MCACGNPDGTNSECERCRLIAKIEKLDDSLTDHAQCVICKKWSHVERMLRVPGISLDLVCNEECLANWPF